MAGPHTTHVVFYTEGETLDVIADCACSRTLAGSRWIKDYIYALKEHDIPYLSSTRTKSSSSVALVFTRRRRHLWVG